MVIISSYFEGETYGLLGPQMAATVIQEQTSYDCRVIAVTKSDDKAVLKKALADYFGKERPVIGFSTLSGREDLFTFAKELTEQGAITILAGPQADVDYMGEVDWQHHDHRFKGLSTHFSFALHGPAEQAVYLLENLDADGLQDGPGLHHRDGDEKWIQNPKSPWNDEYLGNVKWDNMYQLEKGQFIPIRITTAQVLQHVGCPYAARGRWADIDYPVSMDKHGGRKIRIYLKGCAFCDVAVDKGHYRGLKRDTVMKQIRCLPEDAEGRKIPFELINENPLPKLPRLLMEARKSSLKLSQINLILRADWFLKGIDQLREALTLAKEMDVRILLSSIGFESFDDRILMNLNKGISLETNLRAVQVMRELKKEFPKEWAYSRDEGAIHGFIHPTPWDTEETSQAIQRTIAQYGLSMDILPAHSIPLIIHHASGLGDWIRKIERREGVQFKRLVSIIAWWQLGDKFVL